MASNDKGVHVATPPGGEHVQHIHATKEDRIKDAKVFREEKKRQDKIKDERFAAIQERRNMGKKPGGSGGSGGGINIDVTSDS